MIQLGRDRVVSAETYLSGFIVQIFRLSVYCLIMSWESWKKESADRRDTRNTKIEGDRPRSRGKKDRRRWCRGREGIEHKLKCVRYVDVKPDPGGVTWTDHQRWFLLVCTVCGKTLSRHYGGKNRPDWVKEFLEKEQQK